MKEVYRFDLETRLFLCVDHIPDDVELPEGCAEDRPEDGKFSIPKRNESNDGWTEGKVIDQEVELQNAKENKIIELNNACNQVILGGFVSNCLGGVEHQYKFDMEYQQNMSDAMLSFMVDTSITSIDWPTKDVGVQTHTKAQFMQLFEEAKIFKTNNIYRYFDFKLRVIPALETVNDVNLIVW